MTIQSDIDNVLLTVQHSNPKSADPTAFISVWNPTLISDGSSASNQICLPLQEGGIYDFLVEWGDESNDTITSWDQAKVTHTFSSTGVYTITITGTIVGWRFKNGGDRLKLIEIKQWGSLRVGNDGEYFAGCENLFLTTTDILNLTGTTSLSYAFSGCRSITTSGNLTSWDVSYITDMSWMFNGAYVFNQPIGMWDVSQVTHMSGLFAWATAFNQAIGTWNVSQVKDMGLMFYEASTFNQPIGAWDISKVTDMRGMFYRASAFNQPIGTWNVSQVTDMSSMFEGASAFNQPIVTWDVSQVTTMSGMFWEASKFNQPIGAWDVSRVNNMNWMFYKASTFNQPIGAWNVSQVTSMYNMFAWATVFNQPIGTWNVSKVTEMSWMFGGAFAFNQPIDTWDVSQVSKMWYMFSSAFAFNQPIGAWNVSKVTDMSSMFDGASSFNRPIDMWDVSQVTDMSCMFLGASAFNRPIEPWNVMQVTNMRAMFAGAIAFNQPIGLWNISKVTNMAYMFQGASAFNQPIGSWDVSQVNDMTDIFFGVTLSSANYDNLLLGWAQLTLQSGITFHGGNSQYTFSALAAREHLINTFGWVITDGGRKVGPTEFISRWDTTMTSEGSSASNQVRLPLQASGIYNFIIDWGDGSIDNITSWNQAKVIHTYLSNGVYTITIAGIIKGWYFNFKGDRLKIIEIQQWGCLLVGNDGLNFAGCEHLILTTIDSLNLTGTTSLSYTFADCCSIGTLGNLASWDVSRVTNMSGMFYGATTFNQPINMWDVSLVIDMSWMFAWASQFNRPIATWDVSQVTSMHGMFSRASAFNQAIDSWNVSCVADMNSLFEKTSNFNQPINNWNVSNVSDMGRMFCEASLFNQPIGYWDVSHVTNMSYMFAKAFAFNQPINTWNVSQVTDMNDMFIGAILSTEYYDNLLQSWSLLNLQYNVTFHAGYSHYSLEAATVRQNIIDSYGWTIIDGGLQKAPAIIQFLQALAGDSSVTLSWTAPIDDGGSMITGYNVYRSTTNGSGYIKINTASTLNYVDLNVINNVLYFYVVTAVNVFGESEFSTQVYAILSTTTTSSTNPFDNPFANIPGYNGFLLALFIVISMAGLIRYQKTRKEQQI